MHIVSRRITAPIRHGLAAVAIAAIAAAPSVAATFNIAAGGAAGTFEAPFSGGAVSAFNLTLLGIPFDTPSAGNTAPIFRAAFNDFTGTVGGTSSVLNGTAGGGCAALDCAILFEDTSPPGAPPFEWSVLRISTLENLGFGEPYEISPIPLPAAGPLLLAGFGLVAVAARRKRRGTRRAAAG